MEKKKELRTKHKTLRDAMTTEEGIRLSEEICKYILLSELYRNADTVYAYYPLGKEVSLRLVMEDCLRMNKVLALPRVKGNTMDFFQITDMGQVKEGCFHVMEPVTTTKVRRKRALVLTPGLVFDQNGNRIGYGKGYYDNYFGRFPELTRLGVAFQHQVEDAFLSDENDIAMEYLVTEREMMLINA